MQATTHIGRYNSIGTYIHTYIYRYMHTYYWYIHTYIRAHDRNLKYKDKIPSKYIIAQTYQTIFRHHIIIINLLNTIHKAMYTMYEGACCPVTSANDQKFMRKCMCPAAFMSPDTYIDTYIHIYIHINIDTYIHIY